MKAAEIRGKMSVAEIRQEIDNHYQELFNLRFSDGRQTTGQHKPCSSSEA